MLSVGMVTATGGRYYTNLARGRLLHRRRGESRGPGTRTGRPSAWSSAPVRHQDLDRLFHGYHPETGKEVAKNHGRDDRRAALDMCFSVPKGVSARG